MRPAEIRATLIQRDGPTCQWPGCEQTDALTIHHVIPRSLGGGDSIGNLTLLCEPHHKILNRFLKVPHHCQRRFLRPGYPEAWQAWRAALMPQGGEL